MMPQNKLSPSTNFFYKQDFKNRILKIFLNGSNPLPHTEFIIGIFFLSIIGIQIDNNN
jgi:hypothetical protein